MSTERKLACHREFIGCASASTYEVTGKLGEGTFGEVYKAVSNKSGALVALKKVLIHNERDGFPITALREIRILKSLCHENILYLIEMVLERVVGDGKRRAISYMVTPYMHHDLAGLLNNPIVAFSEPQIKCYMLQLLEGTRYLHEKNVLHRDMKAANLLINNHGILQIADFGLARYCEEEPGRSRHGYCETSKDYTALVVTRWYRAPELLLQLRKYTTAIDMWGVGCVFGEMFERRPILAGVSDLNQLQLIFDLVGSPTDLNMPGWNDLPGCDGVKSFSFRPSRIPQTFKGQINAAVSLLEAFLKLDWRKRMTATEALNHPYFRTAPFPARPEDLPSFEDSHEFDNRDSRLHSSLVAPTPRSAMTRMNNKMNY